MKNKLIKEDERSTVLKKKSKFLILIMVVMLFLSSNVYVLAATQSPTATVHLGTYSNLQAAQSWNSNFCTATLSKMKLTVGTKSEVVHFEIWSRPTSSSPWEYFLNGYTVDPNNSSTKQFNSTIGHDYKVVVSVDGFATSSTNGYASCD